MGYPDASIAQGAGPASQDFDPLEMMRSAADLVNPVAAARQMPWLFNELMMMPLGRSGLTPEENDPRFADVTWQENFSSACSAAATGCSRNGPAGWSRPWTGRGTARPAPATWPTSSPPCPRPPTSSSPTRPRSSAPSRRAACRPCAAGGTWRATSPGAACPRWSTGSPSLWARSSAAPRAPSSTATRSSNCSSTPPRRRPSTAGRCSWCRRSSTATTFSTWHQGAAWWSTSSGTASRRS